VTIRLHGNRITKGLGCLLAAGSLLLGCTQSYDTDKNNEPQPLVDDGPVTRYPEPVRMSVWAGVNDVMKFAPGESIEDNLHTRYMKTALNIEFVNKWVADGNKIVEKVNLDIASNDLPDVVQVTLEQLARMIKNDQVEDLTGVWENYATDGLKANMGYQNGIAFTPARKNNRIYGIPVPYDMGNSIALMYIRKDWLDKSGKPVPRTIAQLDELVRLFTTGDPDGNGKDDTLGLMFEQGNPAGGASGMPGGLAMDAIAAGFGVYPGIWEINGAGRAAYGTMNPAMKDVLKLLNAWYDIGAIDREFAIKDLPRSAEAVIQNKVGIVFGAFHYPIWPLKDTMAANPDLDWIVAPIPTVDGKPPIPKALPFTGNWLVVRKGYEHPEALVKALNVTYMMQANEGEPGKFWEAAGNGAYKDFSAHLYMKPYPFDSPVRNLQSGREVRSAIDSGDTSRLVSTASRNIYENYIMSDDPLTSWAFKKVFYEAEAVLADYPGYKYSVFFDAPTPTMQTKGQALAKLEYNELVRIIMGAPLDEFDAFVERWMSLGGGTLISEVDDWIEKNGRNEATP